MKKSKIGIIGEFDSQKASHKLLNLSLDQLKNDYRFKYEWIDTVSVEFDCDYVLKDLTGIWSASGSPFKSLQGVLNAIKYARTRNIAYLGTCGGFQHTIIEYARNVLGIENAQHEEYSKNSANLFITKSSCSLYGRSMIVNISDDTKAYEYYGTNTTIEDYYCDYGINPVYIDKLKRPDFLISGVDQDGEIRIIEIPSHKFYMATLFVPHSRVTEHKPHPLIKAFVENSI
jgi:CTP synthase (UTP-ammonia lyase)